MDFNDLIEEVSERMDMKHGSPDGTFNKVEINGKVPISTLKVEIDRVITLSKSELWGYYRVFMNDVMEMYNNLPAEKQVKVLPNKVKYLTELGKEMKRMAENHKSWNTPRKAQLINSDVELDATDKTSHTYDLNDSDIDLSGFDDVIHDTIVVEEDDVDIDWNDIDDIMAYDSEKDEAPMIIDNDAEIEEIPNTRELYQRLKRRYPRDGSVRQLKWISSKGTIANIFQDEKLWDSEKKRLRLSPINYNSSKHYCKKGDFQYFIIRYVNTDA